MAAKGPCPASFSGGGRRGRPRPMGLGPELAQGRPADQMGLQVEHVVDGGVGCEETLSRGSGFELLLLSLPPSNRQAGAFRLLLG